MLGTARQSLLPSSPQAVCRRPSTVRVASLLGLKQAWHNPPPEGCGTGNVALFLINNHGFLETSSHDWQGQFWLLQGTPI